ncbi:MAG: division plane positioning ATPase MipZ [Pseudomonadota bacterium]|nr:division plane positioning ATPase MipZ [Pseudomonadota bacterium]
MTGTGAHIIVFGNEKGGSGKSTAAMHVVIGLLRYGYSVASIDLDVRQGTFTRYFENRYDTIRREKLRAPCPVHIAIPRAEADTITEAMDDERIRLEDAIAELTPTHDFIVIDTPGSDSHLTRIGHAMADTLITPINDSFIDLDLLARIDPDTHEIKGPSVYSEMVWDQRKARAMKHHRGIDWIVMRNRTGHHDARNKRDVGLILERLACRFGFRLAPGFGERVIFRELFLKGLTLMDMREENTHAMTMSNIAARQEVRALIDIIGPARALNLETVTSAT